ncbi:MAG: AmpG family muropeptide MFS transporter [bacterium]|nr:AmpG family muropeptide MFS transporter [bacterium]
MPAGWRDVLRGLRQPRVLAMLALGFSSGLPFLLTGNTLGAWLRDAGTELAAIGFISWVGLAYSFKFLWAPLLDHSSVPLLARFGRRRSWIMLAQSLIAAGLVAMVVVGPEGGLVVFGAFALVVAFASATQDIAVDAWRIESASTEEELGLLSAAYQLGYRAALLITNALIFNLAERTGWEISYSTMALLMGVGLVAALFAAEPARDRSAVARPDGERHEEKPIWTLNGVIDAIAGPFVAFFKTHGTKALLLLIAVSLYRMPDFVMGPMVNPFYRDLGLSWDTIGAMRASVGLVATLIGVSAGGFSAMKLGFTRTLVLGAFLAPASNLGMTLMAFVGPETEAFVFALSLENFSEGFAGTALIAWMSSLTSFGYVATQYALLSSFYSILGKFLKGFSGQIVETLQGSLDPLTAYGLFFAGTAAIGIPSILAVIQAARLHSKKPAEAG